MNPHFTRARLILGAAIATTGTIVALYVILRDPTNVHVNPRLYDEYAGIYLTENGYLLTLRNEGGRLVAYVPERLPMNLSPENETTFFVQGTPGRYILGRNAAGVIDRLIFRLNDYELTGLRVDTL